MESILLIVFFLINPMNGCVHNGNTYKDGDTWVEKDTFLMHCHINEETGSWSVQITGCKIPSGEIVSINSTFIDGNYEWKCMKNSHGKTVMQKVLQPNATCGEHQHGEKWRETSFLHECDGGREKVIACFAKNDEQINIGEEKEISGHIIKCEKFANGTIVMHGVRKGAEFEMITEVICVDSKGEQHVVDSWWIDGRFNKTCLSSGKVDVLNCISTDGTQIPLNEEVIIDSTKYICEKTDDGATRFASNPVDGTSIADNQSDGTPTAGN